MNREVAGDGRGAGPVVQDAVAEDDVVIRAALAGGEAERKGGHGGTHHGSPAVGHRWRDGGPAGNMAARRERDKCARPEHGGGAQGPNGSETHRNGERR